VTAVDFPNSPSVNDTFSVGERTWKWTGTAWDAVVTPVGVAVGGTQGQVLTKVGNTNYVTTWANTVSSVIGGTGLTGGTITTTGTLAVDSAVIPFLSATQTFQSGNLTANNISGNSLTLQKQNTSPASPGANSSIESLKDGTDAGTLKIAIKAGASGSEVVLIDNIPTTAGEDTSTLGVAKIEGGNA